MKKLNLSKLFKMTMIVFVLVGISVCVIYIFENSINKSSVKDTNAEETQITNYIATEKTPVPETIKPTPTEKKNEVEVFQRKQDIKIFEEVIDDKTKETINNWRKSIISIAENNSNTVILNGRKNQKLVGLTFDDGPDNNITPKIIDQLNQYNVKATFFFLGDNVKYNPDVVKKAFESGHQIAGHSLSHPQLTKISAENIIVEVSKTDERIKGVIGKEPFFFRPPYGDVDEKVLHTLNNSHKIIVWSIDTLDWVKGNTANGIARFVIDNIQPEDIILMHSSSGQQETLKAVPLIIEGLREKGYNFATVSEIVGEKPYKEVN